MIGQGKNFGCAPSQHHLSTVYRVILAPCNFNPSTFASSFVRSWIHPDTVLFKERKFETLEFALPLICPLYFPVHSMFQVLSICESVFKLWPRQNLGEEEENILQNNISPLGKGDIIQKKLARWLTYRFHNLSVLNIVINLEKLFI